MNILFEIDKALLLKINTVWTHPWLDSFFPAITDLHKSPYFFWIVVPLFLGLFVWKYQKKGIMLFFLLLLAQGTTDFVGNRVFKKNIERPRPGITLGEMVTVRSPYGGYSFVSNHAANMFCFAKYVSDFLPQTRVIMYPIAILISYSRMYNGVHYPSDVVGGAILGWSIALLYSMLGMNLYERLRRREAA